MHHPELIIVHKEGREALDITRPHLAELANVSLLTLKAQKAIPLWKLVLNWSKYAPGGDECAILFHVRPFGQVSGSAIQFGKDTKLIAMANKMIADQNKEIEQFRKSSE